jgi:hypothetical protein
LDVLLRDDVLELLSVERKPVKVLIVFEGLGCATCEIVAFPAAFVGEDGVCEGNFLEFLIRFWLFGF